MWSRAQLKGRAKATFKRNYWKCILISLLLTLIAGGSGAASGNISSATGSLHGSDNQAGSSYDYDSSYDSDDGSNTVVWSGKGKAQGTATITLSDGANCLRLKALDDDTRLKVSLQCVE